MINTTRLLSAIMALSIVAPIVAMENTTSFFSRFSINNRPDESRRLLPKEKAVPKKEGIWLEATLYPGTDGIIKSVDIYKHKNGESCVAYATAGTIFIWSWSNNNSFKKLYEFSPNSGLQNIKNIRFINDKNSEPVVMVTSDQGTIELWELGKSKPTCKKTITLPGKDTEIHSLPGLFITYSHNSSNIKVWNSQGACTYTLEGHKHGVNSLCIDDKKKLFSLGYEQAIKIWDMTRGAPTKAIACNTILPYQSNREFVQLLSRSEDKNFLFALSHYKNDDVRKRNLEIIDLEKLTLLTSFPDITKQFFPVNYENKILFYSLKAFYAHNATPEYTVKTELDETCCQRVDQQKINLAIAGKEKHKDAIKFFNIEQLKPRN